MPDWGEFTRDTKRRIALGRQRGLPDLWITKERERMARLSRLMEEIAPGWFGRMRRKRAD